MKRARIAVLVSLVATGCAGIIGVPDLTFDETAGNDGGGTVDTGTTTADTGATTDGSAAACGDVDLATNAAHCGRCGHSCGKSTCTNGMCDPYLVTDSVHVQQIAVDAAYVYYADFGHDEIRRVAKDGVGNPVKVASVTDPIGVAVVGATLYYVGRTTGLYRCTTTDAGACAGILQVGNNYYSENIGTFGDHVYYATQSGAFRSLPDGGEYMIHDTENDNVFSVAASADWVYMASGSTFLYRNQADGGGGAEQRLELISAPINQTYVYVDGDRYFFAGQNDVSDAGLVGSNTHVQPGNAVTYTTTSNFPVGIAADANYVYWSDRGDVSGDVFSASIGNGRLFACPRLGCAGAPLILASNLRGGGPIVLDDTTIYFAENDNFNANGRIRAVAKP